jgi:hypothetical protein
MELTETKDVANFDKLKIALDEAEALAMQAGLSPEKLEEFTALRAEAASVFSVSRAPRYHQGQFLDRCKAVLGVEQACLPIARSFAESLHGRKSRNTLKTLIENARSADKLPSCLRAAMIEANLDPGETKYRPLIDGLVALNFSGPSDAAHKIFAEHYEVYSATKKAEALKRKMAEQDAMKDFGVRIAKQFAANLKNFPAEDRPEKSKDWLGKAARAAQRQCPGWVVTVTLTPCTESSEDLSGLDPEPVPSDVASSRPDRLFTSGVVAGLPVSPTREFGMDTVTPSVQALGSLADPVAHPAATTQLKSYRIATPVRASNSESESIAPPNESSAPLPAGLGLPNCQYIYAPKGQAGEYAPLAANPYSGCGHGCAYCYVPLVTKKHREDFDAGAYPRKGYLDNLRKDAQKYRAAGITEQVLFSFTTDVYNPFDRSLTRPSLQIVQEHGMGICVLTKGGNRALEDIDLYRPDRDSFASTLTTLDDSFSKKWERNAALPGDRIATLKNFHERGIFTWVSLEPTLSVEASLEIVTATHRFVDLYKVGRANYLGALTKNTDWKDYTLRMIDLFGKLGVRHYIKRDLQPYLPKDYPNPLRVPQFHVSAAAA